MKNVLLGIFFLIALVGNASDADVKKLYDAIVTESNKPSFEVFELAMRGYYTLQQEGKIKKQVLTIVDFSKSSTKRRLWVIDLKQQKIIHHSLVSHGKNTGNELAEKFSNIPGSYQSSLGFYVTGNTYFGKHGLSLYLDGVEKGINDKARERSVVMHGANYVSKEFIEQYGRLGRSFGCPAVPNAKNKPIIDSIKGKSCLFIYYPKPSYLANSTYLKSVAD